ncbi:MAG: hypothetical protein H6820_10950 [Phycisphaerales bacterium]|nr:hypothetical protein [Phycisphaerales bacterium]
MKRILAALLACAIACPACSPSHREDHVSDRSACDLADERSSQPAPANANTRMGPSTATRPADPPASTVEATKPRRIEYKPGITLDYAKLQVEIDAQVILRRGELELFAWSKAPVPKEHETILVVDAKPSDVYAALGLIGLTPGTPPHFDAQTKMPIPATGDRVDVFVRYRKNNRDVEHSICDWAIDKSRDQPLTRRAWVFCGSHPTENGTFAADIEGTLVTVVDFPTSLLSLAETHSESNADLWLVANRDAIPDEGTPVKLILRAFDASK